MRLYTDLDRVMPSKLMVAALVLALAGCIVAKQEHSTHRIVTPTKGVGSKTAPRSAQAGGSKIMASSKGHIVAVPEGSTPPKGARDIPKGMKISAGALIKATRQARKTGKPVLVPIEKAANPEDEGDKATTVWRTADTISKKASPAVGARQLLLHESSSSSRGRDSSSSPTSPPSTSSSASSLTLNPVAKQKEEGMARHRKLVAGQLNGVRQTASGDLVTGDGARPTHQPVDEVTKLVGMLPYAFVAVVCAVVFVVCLLGKVMRMKADDQSSYFQKDGMQDSSVRTAPKMKGGFGRRY